MKIDMYISKNLLSVCQISVYSESCKYTYDPKVDITPYELSRIVQLFFVVSNGSGVYYNTEEFIKKYNLDRHFEKTSK